MANNFIIPKQMVANKVDLILRSNLNQFVKPKFFKIDNEAVSIEQQEYILQAQDVFSTSNVFGLPVFDALVFPRGAYIDPKTNQKISYSDVILDTCLIEVNSSKVIVTTQVQGRNGTVKEYISDGDDEITISGALISPHSNVPPRDEIRALEALVSIPYAINVASNFLDFMNINSVVITSIKFNQIEGTRNAIGFTMNCLSDIPYEIQYVKNNSIIKSSASF